MSSKALIEANRRNAKKSTGPSTTKGKAAISQNALKHGLRTDRTVIKYENQADFDLHRTRMFEELAPSTPIEETLAGRIASTSWRLKRVENFQNQVIDAMIAKNTSPIAKFQQILIARYAPQVLKESPEPDPELELGRLAIKDFSNSRVLEKLLMYERRIENSFYRALLEIQRLKMIKKIQNEKSNTI